MSTQAIVKLIIFWSHFHGIDPNISLAVAKVESNLNPNVIGSLGEVGVFQVRPEYVKEFSKDQLKTPEINIMVGIKKLAEAKKMCSNMKNKGWLTCYNSGVEKAKTYKHPELHKYVKLVMSQMN
jgi:soluble lytic murein transglycosylase-like protein